MNTEYKALVKHQGFSGKWTNAVCYVRRWDGSDSSLYFETKEDAENAIRAALKQFNVNDDELRIIDWRISKRLVGDWEIVEGLSLPVERRKS